MRAFARTVFDANLDLCIRELCSRTKSTGPRIERALTARPRPRLRGNKNTRGVFLLSRLLRDQLSPESVALRGAIARAAATVDVSPAL